MSGPAERVIAIIESLSTLGGEGMTAQEVVERSGLTPSTGYRILSELQALGLAHRIGKRRLMPNFSFERRVSRPGLDPGLLAEACDVISAALTTASEIVLLRNQSMIWHVVRQHDAQAIRLRAHPGFTRTAHELDSIGRLALAHTPIDQIERGWDVSAFYSTGFDRQVLPWREARTMIEAVAPDEMQYDMLGNAKGIRRFCVAVRDGGGQMACLLTVAEAAIPLRDERAHIDRIRTVLMEQRALIESGATRPQDTQPLRASDASGA